MKKLLGLIAALLSMLAVASPSKAQSITWGTAQTMTGNTDVADNGTAYDAVSFFSTPLTINTVTFGSLSTSGNSHTDGIITITNGDGTGAYGASFTTTPPSSTSYSDLVNTGTFGENSDTVTIGGPLVLGNTYQVESWSYYTGDGTATTTYSGSTPVSLTNSIGQFSIGTFVATASPETYTYSTGGGHNFVNAVSVRDLTVAVPEPSTWAMMLGGLVMLGFCVRRKASLLK
jgi:hypothetical protein